MQHSSQAQRCVGAAGRAVWAVPGGAGGGRAGVPALSPGRAVCGVGGAHLQSADPRHGSRAGRHCRGSHHHSTQLPCPLYWTKVTCNACVITNIMLPELWCPPLVCGRGNTLMLWRSIGVKPCLVSELNSQHERLNVVCTRSKTQAWRHSCTCSYLHCLKPVAQPQSRRCQQGSPSLASDA